MPYPSLLYQIALKLASASIFNWILYCVQTNSRIESNPVQKMIDSCIHLSA